MDRRGFFQRLIGLVASACVAKPQVQDWKLTLEWNTADVPLKLGFSSVPTRLYDCVKGGWTYGWMTFPPGFTKFKGEKPASREV